MKELDLNEILANTTELKEKKVGYVTIIGRPNAGKSTFINSLLGEKISIVSNIPQTTRKRVLAIYNDDNSQIVFFDTPGVHESNKLFNEEINKQALSSIKEANVILYFIDSSREGGAEEEYINSILEMVNIPVIKVYTKIDLKSKIDLPDNEEDNVKISSTDKIGFEELVGKITNLLPNGPMLYPEEVYTQQDMFFRISEIIREKVFLHTKEELPHSTFIGVDEIEDNEDILKIVAYVYTESESQKYIIIGKAGSLIQKIGKEARLELEEVFGKKVFLALRAKTKDKWRKNQNIIKGILK